MKIQNCAATVIFPNHRGLGKQVRSEGNSLYFYLEAKSDEHPDFSSGYAPQMRSFVFHEALPISPVLLPFSELAFGMLGFFQDAKHTVKKVKARLSGKPIVESRHPSWDNTYYTKSLSSDAPQQYRLGELFEVLADNLVPFADEYCLGRRVVKYPLKLRKDGGTSGIGNGYKEKLTDQSKRFIQKINSVGKNCQRAEIEVHASARLEHWQAEVLFNPNIEIGTKLVWFSPPGFRFEGYHGVDKDHHSFVWVYEKKVGNDGEIQVIMTQFKGYPVLEQLIAAQKKLQILQTARTESINQGLPLKNLTTRNLVIAQMIELPTEVTMDHIESIIYETERDWKVQPTDLPQLTEQELQSFKNELTRILEEFLMPMYREILSNFPNPRAWSLEDFPHLEPKLMSPLNTAFWQSTEYKNIVRRLDNAFGIAYQALLKWVEDCTESGEVKPIPILELRALYDILERKHHGTATDEDKQNFNQAAPILLSAGSRLLSIGQCGLIGLIPRRLLNKMNLFNKTISLRDITPQHLRQLSATEKTSFKKDVLDLYQCLTLTDQKGSSQKFWILKDKYPEYVNTCKQNAKGDWLGPCDIPLSNGSDSFVLTDEEYLERLSELTMVSESDVIFQEVAQLESDALAEEADESQKALLRRRFKNLSSILKPNIGITELINADYVHPLVKVLARTESVLFFDSRDPLQKLAGLERALAA